MSSMTKALLGMIVLGIWGPYLLYVWTMPDAVPSWAHAPGMRKALMLGRDFEPTFFTLMFGIGFTGLLPYGIYRIATGKLS